MRSKAHHLHPIFQIGKNGINDELLKQIGEALEKRELIKISLLQNTDEEAADVASAVEETIDAKAVQIIGRVIVLFKPSSQEKYQRISSQLPAAKKE